MCVMFVAQPLTNKDQKDIEIYKSIIKTNKL